MKSSRTDNRPPTPGMFSLSGRGRASVSALIRLKHLLIILVALSSGLLLTGCDDGCGCDLPMAGRDWLIEVDLGHIPSEIAEYPIYVDFHLQVTSLETGHAPPDGLLVALSISPGSFSNGQTEIELALVDGRQSSTLKIDSAGSYELTVSIDGEGRSSVTAFTVGL